MLRSNACRNCRNGRTRHGSRATDYPDFASALRSIHRPEEPDGSNPEARPGRGLLTTNCSPASSRSHCCARICGSGPATAVPPRAACASASIAALPYSLTPSQQRAVGDIVADLAQPHRMLRLLHGDVGSGKTVVALLAAATVIEAGRQAALMAPTEILARQHFATIAPLAAKAGIRVAILTGRERGRERPEIISALAAGDIDLIVGTHALFQEDVAFADLALGHRRRAAPLRRASAAGFGAQGRGGRSARAHRDADPAHAGADLFRRHGRLGIARKAGRPAKDRHPRHAARRGLPKSIDAVARALDEGRRVYWVCPLVEESETIDLAAAEERYEALKKRFGAAVDLVHGRMRGADKDRAMERFAAGETRLLVATTVIEVGVDVPEASVMVIEHAERFGLAQLHQLRGRIGRGAERSTCLLLYKAPLGPTAKARLAILRETDDGFRIAEEDLKLRGEGDVLGTRQSGMPGFHIARIEFHGKLLPAARDDAALVLSRDPTLQSPRGRSVARAALSVRARRGDQAAGRGIESVARQRIGTEAVRAGRSFEAIPDDEKYRANAGEQDQQPPRGPVDIVKAPCGNRDAR